MATASPAITMLSPPSKAGQSTAPAPHLDAVPANAGIVGMQAGSQGRVNAVGADQRLAGQDFPCPGGILERGAYMVGVLDVADQPPIGAQCCLTKTLSRCLPQHGVQPATVDGELRHIVPGVQPARLRPDRLPEMVGIGELPRPYADRVQTGQQIQGREFPDRMRQGIDADTERFRRRRRPPAPDTRCPSDAASGRGSARRCRRRRSGSPRTSPAVAGNGCCIRPRSGRPRWGRRLCRFSRTGHTVAAMERPRTTPACWRCSC